jgi:hypothetical protein
MTNAMSALAAESQHTALNSALSQRKHKAHTPYIAEAWRSVLVSSGLISRYPTLPNSILRGFDAGIKPIIITYTPPNSSSISELSKILSKSNLPKAVILALSLLKKLKMPSAPSKLPLFP